MRIAIGAYQVIINSFATQITTLHGIRAGETAPASFLAAPRGNSALDGFLKRAKERGWEIVPLGFFYPALGGKLTDEAHEYMKQKMLGALREGGAIDGVFLQMHGTAASESLEDPEGDLLEALRDLVGDATPVYGSLDGHANVSRRMAAAANVLIGVKTNPHSDFPEMGYRAAELMDAALAGSLEPVMAMAQPAMAPALQKLYIAPGWPMEHLMRMAQNRQRHDSRILDISILLGFFVSDRKETGFSVLVTTDAEPQLAEVVAQEISDACWARRHAFLTDMVSVEEGVAEAVAAEGLVVMGDLSDSGGAGTPGDGTALLAAFMQADARGVVIGSIVDPKAVLGAMRAGIGAQVSLDVGGKIDRFHGAPVRISGRVRSLHDGVYRTSTHFMAKTVYRGPVAVIDCGGIEVVLASRHTIPFEPNHFRSLGIEPTQRKVLVCKAEMQHRAGFEGIARHFIDVDTPGMATQDLSRLPYKNIRRPVFPLDDI